VGGGRGMFAGLMGDRERAMGVGDEEERISEEVGAGTTSPRQSNGKTLQNGEESQLGKECEEERVKTYPFEGGTPEERFNPRAHPSSYFINT